MVKFCFIQVIFCYGNVTRQDFAFGPLRQEGSPIFGFSLPARVAMISIAVCLMALREGNFVWYSFLSQAVCAKSAQTDFSFGSYLNVDVPFRGLVNRNLVGGQFLICSHPYSP